MINIQLIRDYPEKIKKAISAKQLDASIVDKVLELDAKWREALEAVEEFRRERNEVAGKKTQESVSRGQQIKKEIKKLEPELKKIADEYEKMLRAIPNLAADDVKIGKDEGDNEIVRTWGEPRKFNFKPKNHWELGEKLEIIDMQRGAKVSGARFFYLKGDGFLLEQALLNLALEVLTKEGFIPIIPPVLIKKESMAAMGYMEHGGENDMFVLERDGLVLVATSEQSIGPMHKDEVLSAKQLPLRYMGYSSCFRREAGSYGKDTRGAFRVHQFNKVEMFSFVRPEDGDKEHEYLLGLEEKLLQALEIPYQVSKMCTGDLGPPAARKYDLNGWFPGQGEYRELTSTSTTTDFQSRRLNIKFQEKGKTEYVHMLNGTAFAQRPILAILENYQQEDGSVVIPEVLRRWMGKDRIN